MMNRTVQESFQTQVVVFYDPVSAARRSALRRATGRRFVCAPISGMRATAAESPGAPTQARRPKASSAA
jgi:hypothetical protein